MYIYLLEGWSTNRAKVKIGKSFFFSFVSWLRLAVLDPLLIDKIALWLQCAWFHLDYSRSIRGPLGKI